MDNLLKWFLLFLLFTPLFYFCIQQKKWYLYFACAYIGLLSRGRTFEIASFLPRLSLLRILIIVLFLASVYAQLCRRSLNTATVKQRIWRLVPPAIVLLYALISGIFFLLRSGEKSALAYPDRFFMEQCLLAVLLYGLTVRKDLCCRTKQSLSDFHISLRSLRRNERLFFLLFAISPSYFALEFSESLPLITFSRALLFLLGLMLLIRYMKDRTLRLTDVCRRRLRLTDDRFLFWCLVGFFVLMTATHSAQFFNDKSGTVKALFRLFIEMYLLTFLLTCILDTREKLVAAVRLLVISSGIAAFIAIVSTLGNYNVFHLLDTVSREMLKSSYYRLNVLRAEAGFGHPVYYGAFCAVMIPLNCFVCNRSKDSAIQRFLFQSCLALNIVALTLSDSRGSLLAFGLVAFVAVVICLWKRKLTFYLRTYFPAIVAFVLIFALIIVCLPNGFGYALGVVDSLVSTVAPGFDLAKIVSNFLISSGIINSSLSPSDTPGSSIVPDYGENAGGLKSRLIQLSGISWTLQRNPVFGFGDNAHVKGLISYEFSPGVWFSVATMDSALVGIVCQYGIVGFLAYLSLYGGLILTMLKKKYRKDVLMQYFFVAFATYMLCQLTITGVQNLEWLLIPFIICLTNIISKENASDHA